MAYARPTLGPGASRTGLVATNCRFPDTFNAAVVKSIQGRSRHVAQDNLVSIQVVYANIAGVAEAAPGATGTLKCAIEYPVGVTQAFLFSGSTSGTLPNGGLLISDALTLTAPIPDGGIFFLRPLANCSSGVGYSVLFDAANFEAGNISSTVNAVTDATLSGTINGTTANLYPVAIIGTTATSSFVIFGDSRVMAGDVNVFGGVSDQGSIPRAVGVAYAYAALSYPAETTANFISGHAIRIAIAAYATHVIDQYGYVDFSTAVSAATVIANKTTMSGYTGITGKPYILTTVEPASTSTDSWASVSGQTAFTGDAQRVSYNTTVRSSSPPSFMTAYIEMADQIESARNSGKWRVLYSSAGVAVANGYTSDGVHSNSTGVQTIRNTDVIRPAQLLGCGEVIQDGAITHRMMSVGAQQFANLDGSASAAQTPTALQLSGGTMTGQLTLVAANGNNVPLRILNGTLLPGAVQGCVEYDGTVFYGSYAASTRGVVSTEQFMQLSAAYTLTSQTAAQKLFNATTNGALTLPVGTYEFECEFTLTGMSATSGSFGFALGGTKTSTEAWWCSANKVATLATAGAAQDTFNTAANTTLATANTNTAGLARIKGIIRVTVAGTVIPQVSLGIAAAAIIGVNSWFRIKPRGSATVTNVGNWS